MKVLHFLPLLAVALVTACVPRPEAPPPTPQQQAQTPPPAPPAPPPAAGDWRDLPLNPGTWSYTGSDGMTQAIYGMSGGRTAFIIRCDLSRKLVNFGREGTSTSKIMTIRTSYGARSLPASTAVQPAPYVWTQVEAADPLLDSIAFSRGHFTVEAVGLNMIVLPSWPEVARVVEDCR